jgi:hypothetical protein
MDIHTGKAKIIATHIVTGLAGLGFPSSPYLNFFFLRKRKKTFAFVWIEQIEFSYSPLS